MIHAKDVLVYIRSKPIEDRPAFFDKQNVFDDFLEAIVEIINSIAVLVNNNQEQGEIEFTWRGGRIYGYLMDNHEMINELLSRYAPHTKITEFKYRLGGLYNYEVVYGPKGIEDLVNG